MRLIFVVKKRTLKKGENHFKKKKKPSHNHTTVSLEWCFNCLHLNMDALLSSLDFCFPFFFTIWSSFLCMFDGRVQQLLPLDFPHFCSSTNNPFFAFFIYSFLCLIFFSAIILDTFFFCHQSAKLRGTGGCRSVTPSLIVPHGSSPSSSSNRTVFVNVERQQTQRKALHRAPRYSRPQEEPAVAIRAVAVFPRLLP